MGRLEQIHNLTNSSLPSSHVAYHKFRGLTLPTDLFLTGDARFAKKVGNNLPTILPNNFARFYQDTNINSTSIFLDLIPPSVTFGSRLKLNRRELVVVEDFDMGTGEVLLSAPIFASYPEYTPIELYGHPINSEGSWVEGDTVIIVKTPYKMYAGDTIVVNDYMEVNVSLATLTSSAPSLYKYQLTLETGIPRDLADDEELLLRAYPAYESEIRALPVLPGLLTGAIGPFVVDWVSGPLVTELTVDETMYIYLMDAAGNVINEGVFNKNDPVIREPIRADFLLFWDVIRGSINWNGSKFLAYTDDRGKFHLTTDLIPEFPTDQVNQWTIRVEPDADVNMRVKFDPNDYQDFSLTGGVVNTVNVLLPVTAEEATRIHILFSGDPDVRIQMSDWLLQGLRVETLKYQVVAKVIGNFNYGCSGLFVKPLFLSIDYLSPRLDLGAALNRGQLLL